MLCFFSLISSFLYQVHVTGTAANLLLPFAAQDPVRLRPKYWRRAPPLQLFSSLILTWPVTDSGHFDSPFFLEIRSLVAALTLPWYKHPALEPGWKERFLTFWCANIEGSENDETSTYPGVWQRWFRWRTHQRCKLLVDYSISFLRQYRRAPGMNSAQSTADLFCRFILSVVPLLPI